MKNKQKRHQRVELKDDFDPLMRLFTSKPGFQPLAARSLYMRKHWRRAYQFMKQDYQKQRYTLKIFLYIGTLSNKSSNDSAIPPITDDLVQWSDLITSLYILGHHLTISSDKTDLIQRLLTNTTRRCENENYFDLVYIDHVGIQQLKSQATTNEIHDQIWAEYGCKFRVLDPFGTDAEFNFAKYDENLIPGGRSSSGNLGLNLRQFLTRFPMSPDNSFLGFAVGSHEEKRPFLKKKKRFVVFGDDSFHLENRTLSWMNFVTKYMRLHYVELHDETMKTNTKLELPHHAIQHGVLSHKKLDGLITKTKAVIGVSTRRSEDILPILAVARGCVVINHKYDHPRDRTNSDFLKGKSSLRKLGSQNPYLEKFVAPPHVITLDINNLTQVRKAIRKIAKKKVRTYIPFELSTEGFLQRINAYVENQNFCQPNDWPPILELLIKVGLAGESCQDVCEKQGLVCEPEYFNVVNATKIHGCRKIKTADSLIAPAKESNSTTCLFQSEPLLYNCIRSSHLYRRICPCRTYKKTQRSLCSEC